MNESETEMTCAELAEVAAELALGVLTGRERAGAVAHLDRCEMCREQVRQLMAAGDELVDLLPEREPPAGFETRVLDRLGLLAPAAALPARPRASWWQRGPARARAGKLLAAAAVLVALAGGGLGGWAAGHGSAPATPLATASFVSQSGTAAGQPVGKVFLYTGDPEWVYMAVDIASAPAAAVTCQLVGTDGQVITLGSFHLADGYGSWGSPGPGYSGQLRGARLVLPDGTVLATASFGS